MLQQPEDVQLPIVLIPITTDAFKTARAVIEGVRHDADLGLIDGHDGPFEESILSHSHFLPINVFAGDAG
jgi:hypothetical protein